ncbi:MAG: hypothetical protein ABIJ96_03000 [Elusimicrobiota bacterium]
MPVKRWSVVVLVCVFGLAAVGTADAARSRRRGSAAKKRSVRRPPSPLKLTPLQQKLQATLKKHIDRLTKENFGYFLLEDAEQIETWMTKLMQIDMRLVRKVLADEYVLRAIFKEKPMEEVADGKSPRRLPLKTFFVDFTLVRGKDGVWRVTRRLLYQINKVKLMDYTSTNDPVQLNVDVSNTDFGPEIMPIREKKARPEQARDKTKPADYVPESAGGRGEISGRREVEGGYTTEHGSSGGAQSYGGGSSSGGTAAGSAASAAGGAAAATSAGAAETESAAAEDVFANTESGSGGEQGAQGGDDHGDGGESQGDGHSDEGGGDGGDHPEGGGDHPEGGGGGDHPDDGGGDHPDDGDDH